jgi:hypothetical protein
VILYGVVCWYDEPASWLAGTVASLSKLGVDHVVAVDGRYPLFNRTAPGASPTDQAATILEAAAGAGMGCTIVRPGERESLLAEPEKRELSHRLVATLGTPMRDWYVVVDADEFVVHHCPIKNELGALADDVHVASLRLRLRMDPHADPNEPDNDVNEHTEKMHRVHLIDPITGSRQSRVFRVLNDPWVRPSHYAYSGVDADGVRINQRGDIGSKHLKPVSGIAHLGGIIEHRRTQRSAHRRFVKADYYHARDTLGIERA